MARRTKIQMQLMKDAIIEEVTNYQKMNISITLRQLFYRLVSRDIVNNTISEYTSLSNKLVEWRKNGTIEDILVDLTRKFIYHQFSSSTLKGEIEYAFNRVNDEVNYSSLDFQPNYMEVWVEKQALESLFNQVCRKYNINLQICKGYTSYTFIKNAMRRYEDISDNIKKYLFYFGDLDPSGLDIYRHAKFELKDLNITFIRPALTPNQTLLFKIS